MAGVVTRRRTGEQCYGEVVLNGMMQYDSEEGKLGVSEPGPGDPNVL